MLYITLCPVTKSFFNLIIKFVIAANQIMNSLVLKMQKFLPKTRARPQDSNAWERSRIVRQSIIRSKAVVDSKTHVMFTIIQLLFFKLRVKRSCLFLPFLSSLNSSKTKVPQERSHWSSLWPDENQFTFRR